LTLYVESNFVLEIVLGQEESQPAERLLALAESGQLARSSPHHQDVAALQTIPGIVARVDAREADRLTQTVERVLGIARRIDTNLAVFREALDFQDRFDLEAQDAIILAAVVADLRTRAQAGPHYFANKNRQDFSVPGIHTESV